MATLLVPPLPTSGEKGSYWFSFSGSLTAWLYTCCRIWRRRPRDGCLFSLWAGSDVPFSFKKAGNTSRCNGSSTIQTACLLSRHMLQNGRTMARTARWPDKFEESFPSKVCSRWDAEHFQGDTMLVRTCLHVSEERHAAKE